METIMFPVHLDEKCQVKSLLMQQRRRKTNPEKKAREQ
jgi:hypothetical protein